MDTLINNPIVPAQPSRAISDEQLTQIEAKVTERIGKHPRCQLCGSSNFKRACDSTGFERGDGSFTGPHLALICSTCGYVHLMDLQVLGFDFEKMLEAANAETSLRSNLSDETARRTIIQSS